MIRRPQEAAVEPDVDVVENCHADSYDNGDVVTDEDLVGTYVDQQEDVYWMAIPSPAQAGRYEVLLADHGAISHFLGTLFKIGNGTYLDLKAIGAVAVTPS